MCVLRWNVEIGPVVPLGVFGKAYFVAEMEIAFKIILLAGAHQIKLIASALLHKAKNVARSMVKGTISAIEIRFSVQN